MKSKLLALGAVLLISAGSYLGYGYYQSQQNTKMLAAQCCDGEMATCTGSKSCNACKNCKYCKHCSKNGGSCGVCK